MKEYKLFLFTCFGGCQTAYSASKACLKIWEKNNKDIKIGCLPALPIKYKFDEILKKSEKRILIDACATRCGKKLFEKYKMPLDKYIELTSLLKIKKEKKPADKELENKIYKIIQKEVKTLLKD